MADQTLQELLAEALRLRARIEATQPNIVRLSVLIRDEQRLRRMMVSA